MRIKILTASLLLSALAACSGNKDSTRNTTPPVDTVKLNGYVSATTESARVTSVELDYEGQPQREVDQDSGDTVFSGYYTASTDTGRYEVSLDSEAAGTPVLLIATNENGNATSICQLPSGCGSTSWQNPFSLETDFQIRAAVGEAAEGMRININWITDLASSLANTVYIDVNGDGETETNKTGFYSEYSIEISNRHIDELLNISDVISVIPVMPSDISQNTELAGNLLTEGIYYGALIAGIQKIAFDENQTYTETIDELASEFLANGGQLYEKDNSSPRLTLFRIYSAAAAVLDDNITTLRNNNAQVLEEADQVSSDLHALMDSMVNGRLSDVQIDVPEFLSSWNSNIEEAKLFIDDLNERFLNFKGDDPDKESFIPGNFADELEVYFDGHTEYFDSVKPNLDAAMLRILDATTYFVSCLNDDDGQVGCNSDLHQSGFVWNSTAETLTVDGDLTLSLEPASINPALESDNEFFGFDIFTEGSLSMPATAESAAVNLTWVTENNSLDEEEIPHIRLIYGDTYAQPPSFNVQEPQGVDVAWPSLSFDPVTINGETHELEILFETSLFGVDDPYNDTYERRYNPTAVVFWVRTFGETQDEVTVNGETVPLANQSALVSEISTVNGSAFYPDSKWPEFDNFFVPRPDDELVFEVDDMMTLYLSTETVNRGDDENPDNVTVEYVDFDVEGNALVRIRVYPPASGVTEIQTCTLESAANPANREVITCGDRIQLSGENDLDTFLSDGYAEGTINLQEVPAHGAYAIDMSSLENADGTLPTLPRNQLIGPFDGTLSPDNVYRLGINNLFFSATNSMVDEAENRLVPTIVQGNLVRRVKDYFEATVIFGYDYDYLVSSVAAGEDAQSFTVGYSITYDEETGFNAEIGTLVVYRSGVTMFGGNESIGLASTSRVEYELGNDAPSCGAYNRDENVSTGDCEAVAYLTYRGTLMATIREEREGVYIVRFVDGTWTMLGEG
ncbi:MAG TPA: hypothetical protein DEA26_05955 [Oceanospirillales bacterium]|nr:hypothetical protein [Oceanospirillaceae bacterium]HBS42204.1 hypothetical protein [Oceanospirillales bacterium]|tara:strand:- start:11156 stop:14065 length:2910 start_codon:yes stop_codon:yes gene_type:complete